MSRTALPFVAEDISSFARALSTQLNTCDHSPSHLELLNMIARSTGFRNFQHFRAQHLASTQPAQPAAAPVDAQKINRLARFFDGQGRLVRWPKKFSHREPCLWVVWSKLPPREVLDEKGLNTLLKALHTFEDHTFLRRMLCDYTMVARTPDCREHQRIERQPPPEALALIRHLAERPVE